MRRLPKAMFTLGAALAWTNLEMSDGQAWTVERGDCQLSPSSQGECVQSPNFPGAYPTSDECKIAVDREHWKTHYIDVKSFDTEGCCDHLEVNGNPYSGQNSPDGLSPTSPISWTSDKNTARSGWKLCSAYCGGGSCTTSTSTTIAPWGQPTNAPATSEDEPAEEDTTIGIVVGVCVGVVVIIAIAACCVAFRTRKAPETKASSSAAVGSGVAEVVGTPLADNVVVESNAVSNDVIESNAVSNDVERASTRKKSQQEVVLPPREKRVPDYWENKDFEGSFFKLEKVGEDVAEAIQRAVDASYKRVATRDRQDGRLPRRLRIAKVQRVENANLWRRYVTERYAVDEKRQHRCTQAKQYGGEIITAAQEDGFLRPHFVGKVNEAYLWHGTSPSGAAGITENGFRLDLAGSNTGKMYGAGMYFAEYSSKSDEYAKDDPSGNATGLYCLLMCRVVLGEMLHMTAGGDSTHSMINEALKSDAYDSVLGDREASVGTYREFVVYQETAAYPEYLVLYKREY